MSKISLKDASRVDWVSDPVKPGSNYPGDTNIQLGCLMRIANATEAMATEYTRMQRDLEYYKKWYAEKQRKSLLLEQE